MSSMGLTFGPQPQLRRDLARSRPLSQSTAFGSTGSLRWCATTLPSGPVPFSGKLTSPTSCRGLNERLLPPSLPTPRPTRGRGCWLSSRPFRVRGPTPGSGSARRVLTTCAFGALPVPSPSTRLTPPTVSTDSPLTPAKTSSRHVPLSSGSTPREEWRWGPLGAALSAKHR